MMLFLMALFLIGIYSVGAYLDDRGRWHSKHPVMESVKVGAFTFLLSLLAPFLLLGAIALLLGGIR